MTPAARLLAATAGSTATRWTAIGSVAVLYYLAAWWGLSVAGLPQSGMSLLWPASGIAYIAALHYGRRAGLPVAALGLGLAGAGAALQAALAARLAMRLAGDRLGPSPFLLSMLVAMPAGAALGAVALVGSDSIMRSAAASEISGIQLWHGVALAHYIGMVVVAPPLWLWLHDRPRKIRPSRVPEGFGYLALAALALALEAPYQPLYLLLAAGIAAVIRIRLKWATLGVAAASMVLLWLAAAGHGPVERSTPYATLLATLSFILVLNLVSYLIGLLWRDLERHHRNLQELVDQRTQALREANARLDHLAHTDPLTGAWNRRHFDAALRREIERAGREGSGLALLAVDLDHFKQINDHHGHEIGDQVLKTVVARWRGVLRANDVLGRNGGDEFVILLLVCEQGVAGLVAERLRRVVADQPVRCGDLSVSVSASLGQVCWHPARSVKQDIGAMMVAVQRLADRRLYAVKQGGRNRIYAGAA